MSSIEFAQRIGEGPHSDFNAFLEAVEEDAERHGVKMTAKRIKLLQASLADRDEAAERVIRRIHKSGKGEADPLRGLFAATIDGKSRVMEYEPDSELRDTETGAASRSPAGSKPSSAAKCCPTRPTPGSTKRRPRSATRSASRAISISRNPCGLWRPSAPTFWRWNARQRA